MPDTRAATTCAAAVLAMVAGLGTLLAAPTSAVASTIARGTTPQTQDKPCGTGSWTGGQVDLCTGTLVYRDYVYDDYGADDGQPGSGSTTGRYSTPAGDERYSEADVNTADLVSLRLSLLGDVLQVRAELNALYRPDSTVLAVAIDTDDDTDTGGGPWGELGVASRGWDVLLTLDKGDPRTNVLEKSFPRPPGQRWRIQAVTAQSGGPVMNVAFRGTDEQAAATLATQPLGRQGVFFEDLQAKALASGDISEFGHTVDVADLLNGITREAVIGPGLHERIYVSDFTLPPGEGMSYTPIPGRGTGGVAPAFAQNFHYFGKYQPYGIYVPSTPAPHGVQLVFHGSNANHATLINQPGMQQQIGQELNRLLVVPLSRGPNGYGSDISERDELDVLADVEAHFPVDLDRIFVGGYSQGGYAAYRFAMLYPDRIAGTISWVGFTGDVTNGTPTGGTGLATAGAVGNVIDLVGNARHIPTAMVYGGADELVHVTSSRAMADEFAAREDYPYVYYLHPTADHFAFALLDEWAKEAEFTRPLTLVHDPARVTFRTAPFLGNEQYGVQHDRAYWVSQIRGRDESYSDIDLTSDGCGHPVPTTATGTASGTEPLPWVADLRTSSGTSPLTGSSRLAGTLTNVASLQIDTRSACLDDRSVTYSLTVDGPSVLNFGDGRTLQLPKAGTHNGVLAALPPVDAPPGSAPPSPGRRLPATGPAASVAELAAALVLTSMFLARRRRQHRSSN